MLFQHDPVLPVDTMRETIEACEMDSRPDKVDLLVGVYRDDEGVCRVLRSVAVAEKRLAERSLSKAYLGARGDVRFIARMLELHFLDASLRSRMASVQSIAGTGALRVLADVLAATGDRRTVYLGVPAYPNHRPILEGAGLRVETYPMLDAGGAFDPTALMAAIAGAKPGDAVLLQGCCHNPSGTTMSIEEWRDAASLMAERAVIPFIDQAYYGLGDGLEADLAGMRLMVAMVPDALVSLTGSKAWGLYSERVGCAVVKTDSERERGVVQKLMQSIARTHYSQPSAHGARVVTEILEDEELRADWREELESMRLRLMDSREALADALAEASGSALFERIRAQRGMFLLLPLSSEEMLRLQRDHGVYGLLSGRINLAGLPRPQIPRVAQAIAEVVSARRFAASSH